MTVDCTPMFTQLNNSYEMATDTAAENSEMDDQLNQIAKPGN